MVLSCVDAKAQIITQLIAVTELLEDGFLSEDDVAFLYVVGEETAGALICVFPFCPAFRAELVRTIVQCLR